VALYAPANRLTAPQAAKLMDISPSHLVALIRAGKIKPASGPGIDKMGQYLFLRSHLASNSDQI